MRSLRQLLPHRGHEDGGEGEEGYSAQNLQGVDGPADERKRSDVKPQRIRIVE